MTIYRVIRQNLILIMVTAVLPLVINACEGSEKQVAERSQPKTTQITPEISYDSVWNVQVRTFVVTWAVSPDLKYAVRETSQFAEPFIPDSDFPIRRVGLYEVLDLHNQSFRLVDTLPSLSESFVFCGPGVLMYTASDFPLKNSRVMFYNFLEGGTPVELAVAGDNDSLNSWIQSTFRNHDFRLQDSLMVHGHAVGTDRRGRASIMQVLVRRLDSKGQFPVIKVIDGVEWPRFSADGKQVLAYRWTENSILYRSSVVVYDLEADSATQLDLPLRFCWRAQRLSKSGPIYYLGTDSAEKGYYYNLHRYDPETGTDTALTNLLPPASISLYQVTPDSIAYQVEKSTGGGVESWWETIHINDRGY